MDVHTSYAIAVCCPDYWFDLVFTTALILQNHLHQWMVFVIGMSFQGMEFVELVFNIF
jgi:hypothetical protein